MEFLELFVIDFKDKLYNVAGPAEESSNGLKAGVQAEVRLLLLFFEIQTSVRKGIKRDTA
ncbi:hypothetical protein [Paenibacillus sp. sgz5001063]|uniref:hypothetical protein n=1 Tax=Paenibacillus sp. sgz5001063 TaxID=3242474 RepID=UPI0036D36836